MRNPLTFRPLLTGVLATLLAGPVLAQPTVTGLSPTRNQRNAPRATNVAVTFDQPISAATASNIRVFSAQAGGRKAGSFSGGGTGTITFNPVASFVAGEHVNVTVPASVQNTGGTPATKHVYQFTAGVFGGSGIFTALPSIPMTDNRAAVPVDVDSDGDLDVLSTTISPANRVVVSFNNGNGTFTSGSFANLTNAAFYLVAGDLDGDSDVDAVTVPFGGVANILLNNGTGTYTQTSTAAGNSQASGVVLGDIDGDGDLDMLVSGGAGASVTVNLNSGSGTFVAGTAFNGGASNWYPALGDIDSDGDLDFVSGDGVDQVAVRFNNGNGIFSGTGSVATGASSAPRAVALGDIDGDGDLDGVAALRGTNQAMPLINNGSGTFTLGTGANGSFQNSFVTLGNFDGDGDLDLVTSGGAVRFNNGSGVFSGGTSYALGTPATFDVDNDGDLDLLGADRDANLTRIYRNGAPSLRISTIQSVPAGTYGTITVLAGGMALLTGNVTVDNGLLVEAGGDVQTRTPSGCVVIQGPGIFSLAAGAQMRICSPQGISASGATGNVQVTGTRTFSPNAYYYYDGPLNQNTGTGLPAQVRGLTKFDVGNLTLTAPLAVREQLRVVSVGNVLLNGNGLTLLSDDDTTALVINESTGTVVGTATVQRSIVGAALGYRHFSAPVTNTTFADLAAPGFTPVVNPAYSYPTNQNVTPFPNIFGFNESLAPTAPDFLAGYFSPASLADPMTPGRGWSVYAPSAPTYDFVGTLGNGTVPVSGLTRTGTFPGNAQKSGWHLLGNPYPAPIDWDLVTGANRPAGMANSISVYQSTGGTSGQYLTRANGLGSLPDGLVAMGQGFFGRVLTGAPLTFTFTNDLRPTGYVNPPHYRAQAETRPVVRLALLQAGARPAETFVYFQAGATEQLDADFDGQQPGRNVGMGTLATLTPAGDELAINGLPETALAHGITVPLLLDLPTAGSYELTAGQLLNLQGQSVVLVDNLTSSRIDLQTQSTYSFTAPQAGELVGRFWLEFNGQRVTGLAPEAASQALTLYPNPTTASAGVRVLGAPAQAVQLLDAMGRLVRITAATAGAATLSTAGLPAGLYTVRCGAAAARLVVE